MRITHPQATYQGIPMEDMFFVSSDQQVQLGTGHVISFFQNEMYPERPLHLYIQIDAQPSARSLLFGALLARADIIRANYNNVPARLYTQISPDDVEMAQFYEKSGLKIDDAEDLLSFSVPEFLPPRTPMGTQYASVPLEGDMQMDSFLQRVNLNRIAPITRDQLTLLREQKNFLAVGFYRGGQPISEVLFAGTGEKATLLNIYTRGEYRRQGFAKALLAQSAMILKEREVQEVYANAFRRNTPQVALMRMLNASYVRTISTLPGLDL